jgi:glycosyltransferase involved in cell wall biosynthesis
MPGRLRVAFVHRRGAIGEQIRIDAVRSFLQERGLLQGEITSEPVAPRMDVVKEVVLPGGMRHVLRKVVRDRAHPLLLELNSRARIRATEAEARGLEAQLRAARGSFDVFHAEGLPAGLALVRSGAPFVFDLHGILAEESKLSGSVEWQTFCARSERSIVEAARSVLVVTPLMKKYVTEVYGKAPENIVVVPNGTEPTSHRAAWSAAPVVVYAGTFAAYENVMDFVRLAEACEGGNLRFRLLGDGPLRNQLFDYVNGRAVPVEYLGRRPRQEALELTAEAQVGFAGQSGATDLVRDYPRQLAHPIKLLSYASCGLPFVCPAGEWADLIEEADCAIVVRSGGIDGFKQAVQEILEPSVWERKAANGPRLIEKHFRWSHVLKPLADLYV